MVRGVSIGNFDANTRLEDSVSFASAVDTNPNRGTRTVAARSGGDGECTCDGGESSLFGRR